MRDRNHPGKAFKINKNSVLPLFSEPVVISWDLCKYPRLSLWQYSLHPKNGTQDTSLTAMAPWPIPCRFTIAPGQTPSRNMGAKCRKNSSTLWADGRAINWANVL